MSVYSYCMFMYLHHASWPTPATLTEVFPCFFLSCKANARVKPAKTGHGLHSSKIFVLFYVLFVCICVLYYCHRVATQLELNILYYIKLNHFECNHITKGVLGWVHTCNVTAYRNTVSWQCGRDSWPRNVSKVGYAVTLRACWVCCRYWPSHQRDDTVMAGAGVDVQRYVVIPLFRKKKLNKNKDVLGTSWVHELLNVVLTLNMLAPATAGARINP